jgi:hypothetical protein
MVRSLDELSTGYQNCAAQLLVFRSHLLKHPEVHPEDRQFYFNIYR